jgi:hypothetical protein
VTFLVILAGCGSGSFEGTLRWREDPVVHAGRVTGSVENTTSHSLSLDPKGMRLLDNRGEKVAGRIRVGRFELPSGASTSLSARWKSGKPVRIDYGAGTLALPSD